MDNPVPFILTGDDGTSLAVDPKAKEALSKIKKPVVVVSVVGMYRTGKSFLLNRLMNRTDGFPLGSTVEAKTKGIWMWVGDLPYDPTRALVLLDTEGLHDPEKGDKTHDVQIFTLAVLLSSVLIYNSKGTIDANSLDGLHLATELTNHISFKVDSEEETGDDFSKFFPMLVWAVRDHHLELKVNREEISANQYLENCLALKKGRSAQVIQYNGLRETIRAFFQNRQCFVFPPPCSMDSLKNLDHMRLDELDHAFIRAGDAFTDFVAGQAPSKVIRGKAITGSMWSTLAEQYVNALLTGNVNIESAYDSMIRMENTKSVMAAIDSYKTEMNKLPPPQDSEALNAANTKAHTTATEIFLKTAVNSEKNQEYSDNMNKELSEIFNSLVERNQKVSQERCAQLLNRLYQAIGDKVARGTFTRPGGHLAYKEEVWLLFFHKTDLILYFRWSGWRGSMPVCLTKRKVLAATRPCFSSGEKRFFFYNDQQPILTNFLNCADRSSVEFPSANRPGADRAGQEAGGAQEGGGEQAAGSEDARGEEPGAGQAAGGDQEEPRGQPEETEGRVRHPVPQRDCGS